MPELTPPLAGKGITNLMAAIIASKIMMDFLGETTWTERVGNAVVTVLKEGKYLTPNLGGVTTTQQVAGSIISALS